LFIKSSFFKIFSLLLIFFLYTPLLRGLTIHVNPIQTNLRISKAIKSKINKLVAFRIQLELDKKTVVKLGKQFKKRDGIFSVKVKIDKSNNELLITSKLLNYYGRTIFQIKSKIKNISFIYDAIDQAIRKMSEQHFSLQLRSKKIDLKILIDASAKMNLIFKDTKRSLLNFLKHMEILNKKNRINLELLFFRNNKLLKKNSDDLTTIKNVIATGFHSTDFNNIITQIKRLDWGKNSSRFLIIYTNSPLKEIDSFLLKSLASMRVRIIAIPADNPTMSTIDTLNRAAIITDGIIKPPIYAVNYSTGKKARESFILNERGELHNLERPFYSENFFYYPNYIKNPKRTFRAEDILDGLKILKRGQKSITLNISKIQSNLAELIWISIEKKLHTKLIDRITPNGKITVKAGKKKLSFVINNSPKYQKLQKRVGEQIYLGIFLNPSNRGKLILNKEPLFCSNPPLIIRTTYQRIINNPNFYRSRGILTPNCWFIPVKILSFKD